MNQLAAFIRIPKTGSSSIIAGFEKRDIKLSGSKSEIRNELWVINNATFRTIQPSDLLDHYTFATIRNPLSRFFSGWRFCLRMKWIPKNMDPMELLRVIRRKDWEKYPPGLFYHVVIPQSRWIFRENVLICDNILKFEDLEADSVFIGKLLGLKNFSIPHIKNSRNQSELHPGTDAYYTIKFPNLRKVHRNIFAEDWERLGYE